jgi:uncharacterized protein (UPF0335 family)
LKKSFVPIKFLIFIGSLFFIGGCYKTEPELNDVANYIKYVAAEDLNEHPDDVKVLIKKFERVRYNEAMERTEYRVIVDIYWDGFDYGELHNLEWKVMLSPKHFGLLMSCNGCVPNVAIDDTSRWFQIYDYCKVMIERIRLKYKDGAKIPKEPPKLVIKESDELEYMYDVDDEVTNKEIEFDTDLNEDEQVGNNNESNNQNNNNINYETKVDESEKINEVEYDQKTPYSEVREEMYGDMECPPPNYCE